LPLTSYGISLSLTNSVCSTLTVHAIAWVVSLLEWPTLIVHKVSADDQGVLFFTKQRGKIDFTQGSLPGSLIDTYQTDCSAADYTSDFLCVDFETMTWAKT
jgi:hypothetical protein